MILSLLIKKVEEKEGHGYAKEMIRSIADNVANDIQDRIKKSNNFDNFEESLNIINLASNEIGFMSSLYKEDDESGSSSTYSLVSRNCAVYKIAVSHQDIICHGFHDRVIEKSLGGGKVNARVQLKECIALGDNYSRHIITTNKKFKT
jgi:predicted ArsR family transcriptional regulator